GRDFTGEIEEVVINEEEATELMVLDELQLVFETTHRLRVVEGARRVALPHSGLAQLGQRLGCGRATRAAEVREGVAQVARDVEGLTALGEDQRSSDSIRTVTEQRHDFVQWPQVKFAVRISHPMRAIERRPMTDRDHDVVQPVQLAPVIMDISSCTDGKLQGASDVDQGASERHVPPDPVSLDLAEEPVAREDYLAMLGESPRGADPLAPQCPRQQSAATPPGENDQPVVPRL